MKILITGASGYLGRRLSVMAARQHEVLAGYARRRDRVLAGEPVRLDLERRDEVVGLIRDLRPEAILHTAAINPGGPEAAMMAVNGEGTRAVAEAAAAIGARLVHISTDVVHNGQKAPYADDAKPTPLGLYPRTKAFAEQAVRKVLPAAAIVRTSLIYGLDEPDHGTSSFMAKLDTGEPLRLFADVFRQPVWVETLAEALVRLATNNVAGFLNVAGSEVLSRDAFGRRMLAFWGHGEKRHPSGIESIQARELAIEVAQDLRLKLDRAKDLLGMDLPGVREVLRQEVLRQER